MESFTKQTELIAELTSHSSPRSSSETDMDDEMIPDTSSCSAQNDSDSEMRELRTRFSQTFGKRFSAAQQENVQGPLIKRRKEVISRICKYNLNLLKII